MSLLVTVITITALVLATIPTTNANAAQITTRSLTLQAGATDGGSLAGGDVNHFFEFTVPNVGDGNVGSIEFLYCTTAAGTCTTPTGLSTTSATLGGETGATGFSVVNTTNGTPYLTRTAASITAGTTLSYQLDTITNPTAVNETFFVRISTYTSTNTTGSPVDEGVVAASTAEEIVLTGTMPESLIFCTGETISTTATIPDCSTATAGTIAFNQLFSPSATATATSQMAASTNAGNGYSITVNGPTMTSGSNTIDAMTVVDTSTIGTGQFGLNLKDNATPDVGVEVAPTPDGTDWRGQATTDYGTVDNFKFVSGDSVAASDNGGAGPTNSQIFTSTYIVNVPGNQPAGDYTTTLTYICTATF